MSDVEDRVRNVIVRALHMELAPEQMDKALGQLDSVRTVELIVQLENEFDINLDSEELGPAQLGSVAQITAMVGKHL